MKVLVIAEHDNSNLKTSTLNTVSAALLCGPNIEILVAGHNCENVAKEASLISGVSKVLTASGEQFANGLAENIAEQIISISSGYSHIIAPSTVYGKNIMPRVAARLDVAQISDISSVESSDIFKRPIYAGNAIATVQSTDKIKVITVRTTGFDLAKFEGNAEINSIEPILDVGKSQFISKELVQLDRPELVAAQIIVSGGRGLGSSENFKILEPLADKLGAGMGASRAAVDAGFVPNDWQVGQTGKIVAPNLYIAIGISGAIQHLAGMKDSKTIVAINKDPDAPIFGVADYGLVGDLFELVPAFVEEIS